MTELKFEQNTFVIVTGAGGGIGRRVARRLADENHDLLLIDKSQKDLDCCQEELADCAVAQRYLQIDFEDASLIKTRLGSELSRGGNVSGLAHVAGLLDPQMLESVTFEAWDRHFAVNVRALLAVVQSTIPHMTVQNGGAIVAVTSNAANIPRIGMGAYAASKAAAQALMKCLGLEVASRGIRCNTIAPGSTQTPMLTALWDGADRTRQTLEGDPETFRVGIPLGRIATPDDIANGVAFLLSEHARHITLQTLTIDGGASLGV